MAPTTRLASTLNNGRLVYFQRGIHPRDVHRQIVICIVEYEVEMATEFRFGVCVCAFILMVEFVRPFL